jgi:Uma2 family endonuclease
MAMSVHTRRFTADELADLPDDGNRYEVIDGELFMTPAPMIVHQRLLMMLLRQLDPYAAACELELLPAQTAVRASSVTEVQPDLLVFSRAADAVEDGKRIHMRALWLAVEVLSPSTTRLDRERKRTMYLGNGVREYWIVDGETRSVDVWVTGAAMARVERSSLEWQPMPERDALRLDLLTLFDGALDHE